MGTKYLIDSNAVIDYLRGSLPKSGMTFMDLVINDLPKVSIITKMEVLSFNTTTTVYKILTNFFDDALVLPLTDEVVSKTIDLRKNHKIKLPDAIIAATAFTYKLALITRNSTDFQDLTGLDCVDAYQQ